MKHTTLPIPELGAIAVTRGMLGAGAALLLTSGLSADKRKAIGLPLLLIGAVTTFPLVYDVLRRVEPAPHRASKTRKA